MLKGIVEGREIKNGFCMDCGNSAEECCCDELAMSYMDPIEFNISFRKEKAIKKLSPTLDCATCSSFNCTDCPRYNY